jgi:hypothetical protein
MKIERHQFGWALWLCGVGLLNGCHVIGWVGEQVVPRTVAAQFEPKNVPTIVLVDDPKQMLPTPQMMDQIAGRVTQELVDNKVFDAENLIDPGDVTKARIDHTDFDRWSVPDIAKHVGAAQVIHLKVVAFHLGERNEQLQPTAELRIKVWDIPSRKRVFPASSATVDYATTRSQLETVDPATKTHTRKIALSRSLLTAVADKTARLFYTYKPGDFGTGITIPD